MIWHQGLAYACVLAARQWARMRDEAARIIWERFSPRLKNLVRRHLDAKAGV